MSTTPLVSVAFMCFNHEQFVEAALLSAIGQDYDELEVVVADDGSSDNTRSVVECVARRHPERVVVLPDQGHLGVVGNGNRLLAACRGKYVAFLDGDDLYFPGKIKRQVEWFEASERRVLCGHDVEAVNPLTGERLWLGSEVVPLRRGTGAEEMIRRGVPFAAVSVMVRASAVPPWGYDTHLRMILDWKLWIDCLVGGGSFGWVQGVLARYHKHPGSVTSLSQSDADQHAASFADSLFTVGLVETRHAELLAACRYARSRLFYTEGVWRLLRGERAAACWWVSWKVPLWLGRTFLPGKPGPARARPAQAR
jgi:glycosyltransferase involved in cell wall biosynthesis